MSLDHKELERLQKLACIKLSFEQETKLGNQLQNIIAFLDKLQEINASGTLDNHSMDIENPLRALDGIHAFADSKALLHNVKHEKINNSIVIKSVLG